MVGRVHGVEGGITSMVGVDGSAGIGVLHSTFFVIVATLGRLIMVLSASRSCILKAESANTATRTRQIWDIGEGQDIGLMEIVKRMQKCDEDVSRFSQQSLCGGDIAISMDKERLSSQESRRKNRDKHSLEER